MTKTEIKEVIAGTEFNFYGIRIDSGIRYNVGDAANNSRQLFQDPDFDEDGELIYPYIEGGIYKGFYDGGELDGTCAIGFNADDDSSIARAIEMIDSYFGDYIHILGGDAAQGGYDSGELIIGNAEVLGVFDR